MKKNKKGFTLIEIIVVVVVLAVLMAVAVPAVLNYVKEADSAKYLTVSRSINEEVRVYVAKKMIDNGSQDFKKTVQELKSDLSYGQYNKLNSIITTKALNDDMIFSIDCEFDGKTGANGSGWGFDPNLKTHSITKISIWFRKTGETDVGLTESSKFVVTLLNEKMYPYMDPMVMYNDGVIGKKEGPILGFN
ncbi:MAG: prepilin-type N-terminal cleavage/methylation domain-containing protein [Coprobacillus sp.]